MTHRDNLFSLCNFLDDVDVSIPTQGYRSAFIEVARTGQHTIAKKGDTVSLGVLDGTYAGVVLMPNQVSSAESLRVAQPEVLSSEQLHSSATDFCCLTRLASLTHAYRFRNSLSSLLIAWGIVCHVKQA